MTGVRFTGVVVGLIAFASTMSVRAQSYPFASPPLDIISRVDGLTETRAGRLSSRDLERIGAVWKARKASPGKPVAMDDDEVELHLIAGGAPESVRPAIHSRFRKLVARARTATASADGARRKADCLLRFLHSNVMSRGYTESQSTLHGVFETGQFNCVSSTELYFLVGSRLGLKLQPVKIPGDSFKAGHAAVDLLDGGTRIQIEPTNPDGFDWSEKVRRPGVVVVGFQPDRGSSYDCDGLGLAASAAGNGGYAAGRADPPRRAEAVRCCAVALALSPADPSAINNMDAAVSNWALAEMEAGRFEASAKVHAFGVDVLGRRKTLMQSYHVLWERWLDATFTAEKFAEGLKLLKRASKAFPESDEYRSPAPWLERAAVQTSDRRGWKAGMAFARNAIREFQGEPATAMRRWQSNARRLQSQRLLEEGDVEASFKVLAEGLAESRNDEVLVAGLGYHMQEALRILANRRGLRAAAAHYRDVNERFPRVESVGESALAFAKRSIRSRCDAEDFSGALKDVDQLASLAGGRTELLAAIYDSWARSLSRQERYRDSVAKYAEGLKAAPGNDLLANNAIATVDQWASRSIERKNWEEARRIYDVGLRHFPNDGHLKRNREYCDRNGGE